MSGYPNLTEDQIEMFHDDPDYLDFLNAKANKMHEITGDMWSTECCAVCVTTNGFIKKNGENVMGAGCAKQAADYFPEIPYLLGKKLKQYGNVVQTIRHFEGVAIVAFPTKPEVNSYLNDVNEVVAHMRHVYKDEGCVVPGWACKAMLDIIKRSAEELVKLTDKHGWKKVVLPRPGCSNGGLDWKDVKPVLKGILDGRFYIITQ